MTKLKYPIEVYESYIPSNQIQSFLSQECIDKYVDWRMCIQKSECNSKRAKEEFHHCKHKHQRRLDNYQVHFAANSNPFQYRKNPISNNIW